MADLFAGTDVRKVLQTPHGRRPNWHLAIWGGGSDVIAEPVTQVRMPDETG